MYWYVYWLWQAENTLILCTMTVWEMYWYVCWLWQALRCTGMFTVTGRKYTDPYTVTVCEMCWYVYWLWQSVWCTGIFADCDNLWDVFVCLLTVRVCEMYWYVYWLWQAVDELIDKGILDDDPMEIARFLHTTKRLWACKKREFLERRWSTISCCKCNIFSVCLNLYCSFSLVDLLWPVITKGLPKKKKQE